MGAAFPEASGGVGGSKFLWVLGLSFFSELVTGLGRFGVLCKLSGDGLCVRLASRPQGNWVRFFVWAGFAWWGGDLGSFFRL